MTDKKPRLSIIQIFNMSFGFLGIQFGFGLQNANVSRIFETLGAAESEIAGLWLAAPVTGLLVQPIIGYLSDRTWHPILGRRKPYFLIGAILSSIALIMMPNSPTLWVAAGLLWMLDASINISMEPFRAFVGDKLNESQRTQGFAMQSFFIGVGAVVASALPYILRKWFGVYDASSDTGVPYNVKLSFYIGAAVFIAAVLYTVLTTKEYPPAKEGVSNEHIDENDTLPQDLKSYQSRGLTFIGIGLLSALVFWYFKQNPESSLTNELYVLSGIFILFGLAYLLTYFLMTKGYHRWAFVQIIRDFKNMPNTMSQLAYVQFFTWFALFSMWIYATPAVTSHIYQAAAGSEAYNQGADWIGVLFSGYNGIAALYALCIPVIARFVGNRKTHLLSLAAGGLGLISFYFITNPNLLLLSMIGVGVAWASILSIPYALLTGSLPENKIGYYMGIFNFFIVIPQIVAASLLGLLVKTVFQNQTIYALVLGGICFFIAGLLTLRVEEQSNTIKQV